jgi:hypothetical protein
VFGPWPGGGGGAGVSSFNGETGAVTLAGPMVTTPGAGAVRVDNANMHFLPEPFVSADIDTDSFNGFSIPQLTANLTVPIPTAPASTPAESRRFRKVTFIIVQAAAGGPFTVTWTGGAGGYLFAKAGSSVGPTVAQFNALLAAMAANEKMKVFFEYTGSDSGLGSIWLCEAIAGPYVY